MHNPLRNKALYNSKFTICKLFSHSTQYTRLVRQKGKIQILLLASGTPWMQTKDKKCVSTESNFTKSNWLDEGTCNHTVQKMSLEIGNHCIKQPL